MLALYGVNQAQVQRYLSSRTEKQAIMWVFTQAQFVSTHTHARTNTSTQSCPNHGCWEPSSSSISCYLRMFRPASILTEHRPTGARRP